MPNPHRPLLPAARKARQELKISAAAAPESNAALARRIVADDAHAFAVLVDRYHDFVFRICFSILRHRQDAEDATQETFTRVVRYLDRWDPRRPLEPWLAKVAGNRSRSQLARRKSHAPLTSVAEPPSDCSTQAQAAAALREEIALALRSLPTRQRQAFELFHQRSMPYAEIAEQLRCPVGTVKTLVHRARAGLIQRLQHRDVLFPSGTSSGAPTSPGDAS
ncbi:sigma-70 family RNA polymerase sigma factor [Roseiconus nitratireducens]|uniref:Sigma-70 family RNA polymerase sigma factor n=1 Tax=Roseiconus nitratireducens TaxID=2605748 RepID=A0A5M6DAF6_9BACT|nr:sigma-70 family RNA polymerase sigma factor [Roseiconus nitratireducens]KAA5544538.1 sigma-70 family RNA polymerase sigma factor [Roseiconus nitratireducens]